MPQPFGIGDVVGGRYRITHHVVTSADQDIIFQATDNLLGREVSVLLASRANAKQVATSAKELATGERESPVEVLDLGLAEDRTFLISTVVDPNQLLDLVVPDTAPYVEPYYTDSLGSELFGQSREMEPQTYEDDAEYYARLQAGLGAGERERRRALRPAFLDLVTPAHRRSPEPSESAAAPAAANPGYSLEELESELESAGDVHGLSISREISRISFSLRSDLDVVEADPAADAAEDPIEAITAVPGAAGPLASETRADAEQPGDPGQGTPPGSPQDPLPAVEPEPRSGQDTAQGVPGAGVESFGASVPGGPFVESAPSAAISTVGVSSAGSSHPGLQVDELLAQGEEVVDDPPETPDESYDRHSLVEPPVPQAAGNPPTQQQHLGLDGGSASAQEPGSFTTLISTVPQRTPSAFPAGAGSSETPQQETLHLGGNTNGTSKVPISRWIALGTLAVLILAAAIIVFAILTGN